MAELLTDLDLAAIRTRDAADYQSLVALKQVAESVDNKELHEAIHMIQDRHVLLAEVDRLRRATVETVSDERSVRITSVGTAAFDLAQALANFHSGGSALDVVEKLESFINAKARHLTALDVAK